MDAQALIQIYRTGFFICAAVAVLGLVLSVLFFIRFRIGSIWAIRTGRAEQRAVHAMQEASRKDGSMRREEKRHGKVPEDSPPETTEELETEKITEMLASEPETELLEPEILENHACSFRITQQIVLIHTEERIMQRGDRK